MNEVEMIKALQDAIDSGTIINSQYYPKEVNLPNLYNVYKILNVRSWEECLKKIERFDSVKYKKPKKIDTTAEEIQDCYEKLSVKLKKEKTGPTIKEFEAELGFTFDAIKSKLRGITEEYMSFKEIKAYFGFPYDSAIRDIMKSYIVETLKNEYLKNNKIFTNEELKSFRMNYFLKNFKLFTNEKAIIRLFNVNSLSDFYNKYIFLNKQSNASVQTKSVRNNIVNEELHRLPEYLSNMLEQGFDKTENYPFIMLTIVNYCKVYGIKRLLIGKTVMNAYMVSVLIKELNAIGVELNYEFYAGVNHERRIEVLN